MKLNKRGMKLRKQIYLFHAESSTGILHYSRLQCSVVVSLCCQKSFSPIYRNTHCYITMYRWECYRIGNCAKALTFITRLRLCRKALPIVGLHGVLGAAMIILTGFQFTRWLQGFNQPIILGRPFGVTPNRLQESKTLTLYRPLNISIHDIILQLRTPTVVHRSCSWINGVRTTLCFLDSQLSITGF